MSGSKTQPALVSSGLTAEFGLLVKEDPSSEGMETGVVRPGEVAPERSPVAGESIKARIQDRLIEITSLAENVMPGFTMDREALAVGPCPTEAGTDPSTGIEGEVAELAPPVTGSLAAGDPALSAAESACTPATVLRLTAAELTERNREPASGSIPPGSVPERRLLTPG